MNSNPAWYEAAFEAEYLEVYAHRNLEAAQAEVAWLVRQGVGGRMLDLCCGAGRHTLALREVGACVFGLDLSRDLLLRRARTSDADSLRGRLVRADVRFPPFRDAVFDCVVNLFSSFGYFGKEGDLGVLDQIARILRPGGLLVLDLMNPERIRSSLVPETKTDRNGFRLHEKRHLEENQARVIKQVHLVGPNGEEKRWREDVRLYETQQMRGLLAERGLYIESTFGDFADLPLTAGSPRQILIARKSG